MGGLSGKVALVTGAGRGIGRVIAQRLAKDGAAVVVNYARSREGADEVVAAVRESGGAALAVQADITRREEIARLFQEIDRGFGRLDIVVNSAGASAQTPLATLDPAVVEAQLDLNFRAPLYVAAEASHRLGEGGRIVNISSTLAEFPIAGSSLYSATKSAMKTFTEVWAKELGPKGVTVNTVIPGATSPGMMDASPQYREHFEKASPFGRIGRAEEIAAVVAFLCSTEASWVSGTHIRANGAATT